MGPVDGGKPRVFAQTDSWGEDLWRTAEPPVSDVRIDHAVFDGAGNLWETTFGISNMGLHVQGVDGKLIASIKGFELEQPNGPEMRPYLTGVSVLGTLGEQDAWAV